MTYEDVLTHFKIQRRYQGKAQAICPAHTDREASLTITSGRESVLIHCHAGCSIENVLAAAGLKKSDLFYEGAKPADSWRAYIESREKKKIDAVYNYVSTSGEYAFTKIRLQDKKMLYGVLRNGRFTYGLGGRTRKELCAVYAPDGIQFVSKAILEGKPIFIPEGEKDVDTLSKQGYVAFTYGGVNDWTVNMAQLCKDATVYVLADNDEPGKRVAKTIQSDLQGIAKSTTKVVPVPDVPKADISDYFVAGHTKEEFEKLILGEYTESDGLSASEPVMQEPDNLDRFHVFNAQGKITGVFDFAIFEQIKSTQPMFVMGGVPYLYQGGVYIADETGAQLKTAIRDLMYPVYKKSNIVKRIYDLFLIAAELQATFEDVNKYPPYWINFRNGFYDVKAGRMIPHGPEYRAINQIPHEYNPDAEPEGKAVEAWLQFICPVADDREMLLQFMGLTLTLDVSQQKFLVLCGEGGSGKSTLIRLNEAMTGSQNISNISLTELQQRFASFGLMGKLLNSCADLEISALEDTSTLKKCLGEDTLRGEQKGRDAISFKSYAKLIFSTNELPLVISENTNGFYRRLLVLPMNKVPEKKNTDFFSDLAAEIDYFIKLSVEALGRMYKAGVITESRASVAAVNQLRCDSDTVQAYIMECCSLGGDFRADRVTMYRKYSRYCEDNDRTALKKTAFFKSVRSKGFEEFKTNGEWFFKGISLDRKIPYDSLENSLDGFNYLPDVDQEETPFD